MKPRLPFRAGQPRDILPNRQHNLFLDHLLHLLYGLFAHGTWLESSAKQYMLKMGVSITNQDGSLLTGARPYLECGTSEPQQLSTLDL